MFHRLWTLIRKELQSHAARAADAGDFNHAGADSGAAVSLCRDAGGDQRHHRHLQRGQRSPRGGTHSALLPAPKPLPTSCCCKARRRSSRPSMNKKLCWWCASRPISRAIWITIKPPAAASARRTQLQQRANRRQLSATDCEKLSAGAAGG